MISSQESVNKPCPARLCRSPEPAPLCLLAAKSKQLPILVEAFRLKPLVGNAAGDFLDVHRSGWSVVSLHSNEIGPHEYGLGPAQLGLSEKAVDS
mmetsp:Transcript_12145/g.21661  ORF Transcript_12145/g.21661 Transcript_12145/m.21661 type:complete len:95 (+) Transcript_12145:213-497(+)